MHARQCRLPALVLLPTAALLCCVRCTVQHPASQGALVPHAQAWGIYALNLTSQEVALIYSSPHEITNPRLSNSGDRLVFSLDLNGEGLEGTELFTLRIDGTDLRRLTHNQAWDLYPAWSPDDAQIAFLSLRQETLDIYITEQQGGNQRLLYDSGQHDADIDWRDGLIAFTSGSRIWLMNSDGTSAHALTDPPRAGEWGSANLPFGDYDPRISPDGMQIVFERMVDDRSPHGNYDLFLIDTDGFNLTRLTRSGYSQGMPNWSHDGMRIVYAVAAIGEEGVFDIYIMHADGSGSRNVAPEEFPAEFLCHAPFFSRDDSIVYFVGQWWSAE
jgi:TolB protein